MCIQTNISAATTSVFAMKKAKTAKNVLDKKVLAAGITVLALQFLQAEKQKHLRIIGVTSYWDNCPYITIFINRKTKIRMYN